MGVGRGKYPLGQSILDLVKKGVLTLAYLSADDYFCLMPIESASHNILVNLLCLTGLSLISGILYTCFTSEGIFWSLGLWIVYVELLLILYHVFKLFFGTISGILAASVILLLFEARLVEWLVLFSIGLLIPRILSFVNDHFRSR